MKKTFVALLVIILGVVMVGCSSNTPQIKDKDLAKKNLVNDTPENVTQLISGLILDEATDLSLRASGEIELSTKQAEMSSTTKIKFGEIKGDFKKNGDVLYEINDVESSVNASASGIKQNISFKINSGVYRKDENVYEKTIAEMTMSGSLFPIKEESYVDHGKIDINDLLGTGGTAGEIGGFDPSAFSDVDFASFFLGFSDNQITPLITDGILKLYQVNETSKALLAFDSIDEIVKYGFLDFFGSETSITPEGKLAILLTFGPNKVIQRIEIKVIAKISTTELGLDFTGTLKMNRVVEYKELGELPFPDFSIYVSSLW